jgi:hypothetical protein
MATKAELIGQIEALETELTSSGVDYVKADTTGTNSELEQEIERLESLIPDDESPESEDEETSSQEQETEESESSGDDESADEDEQSESNERTVKINKGVNIQIRIDGKKLILHSEKEYSLPADRAKSIVAEKKGLYVDGI